MTGRPPIPEYKMSDLWDCFKRGDGPSAAARTCGVHRNTASAYFAVFRELDTPPKTTAEVAADLVRKLCVRTNAYTGQEQ